MEISKIHSWKWSEMLIRARISKASILRANKWCIEEAESLSDRSHQYSKSSEFTPAMDNTFTELSSRKLFGASQLVSVVEHVCKIWGEIKMYTSTSYAINGIVTGWIYFTNLTMACIRLQIFVSACLWIGLWMTKSKHCYSFWASSVHTNRMIRFFVGKLSVFPFKCPHPNRKMKADNG